MTSLGSTVVRILVPRERVRRESPAKTFLIKLCGRTHHKKTNLYVAFFLSMNSSQTRFAKQDVREAQTCYGPRGSHLAALRELQSDWSIRTFTPSRLEPGFENSPGAWRINYQTGMSERIPTKMPPLSCIHQKFSFNTFLISPCYCSLPVCLHDALLYQGITWSCSPILKSARISQLNCIRLECL